MEETKDLMAWCYWMEIGFNITKNLGEAENCGQAVDVRVRNGSAKIGRHDELKTRVMRAYFTESETSEYGQNFENEAIKELIIAVHCRSHESFDIDKIVSEVEEREGIIINSVEDLPEEEMIERYKIGFAQCTPITTTMAVFDRQDRNFVHYFDQGVLYPVEGYVNETDTMMTNAFDKMLGFEFNPRDLITVMMDLALSVYIGDIVEYNPESVQKIHNSFLEKPMVGMLGGNSAETLVLFQQKFLEEYVNEFKKCWPDHYRGDKSNPHIISRSVPEFGRSMNENQNMLPVILEYSKEMLDQGVNLLLVPCNTLSKYKVEIQDLCDEYGAKFIAMTDSVINYVLEQHENQESGEHARSLPVLLAIDTVGNVENQDSPYHPLYGYVNALTPELRSRINKIAYLAKEGKLHSAFNNIKKILASADVPVNKAIMALTELCEIHDEFLKTDKSIQIFKEGIKKLGAEFEDGHEMEFISCVQLYAKDAAERVIDLMLDIEQKQTVKSLRESLNSQAYQTETEFDDKKDLYDPNNLQMTIDNWMEQ